MQMVQSWHFVGKCIMRESNTLMFRPCDTGTIYISMCGLQTSLPLHITRSSFIFYTQLNLVSETYKHRTCAVSLTIYAVAVVIWLRISILNQILCCPTSKARRNDVIPLHRLWAVTLSLLNNNSQGSKLLVLPTTISLRFRNRWNTLQCCIAQS